jgi:hypothetical protein
MLLVYPQDDSVDSAQQQNGGNNNILSTLTTEENLNTIIEIISDLIIGSNQKIFTNLFGLNIGSKSITGLSMYLWSIIDRVLVAYMIE